MAYRKEANLCLRYGSGDHYIRQCHLGLTKKPNTTIARTKKPKSSIIAAKSKKRPIATPATTDEAESSDETSLVDESENE
jgi:hypothetical protein